MRCVCDLRNASNDGGPVDQSDGVGENEGDERKSKGSDYRNLDAGRGGEAAHDRSMYIFLFTL